MQHFKRPTQVAELERERALLNLEKKCFLLLCSTSVYVANEVNY